jgi:hypothetical protein
VPGCAETAGVGLTLGFGVTSGAGVTWIAGVEEGLAVGTGLDDTSAVCCAGLIVSVVEGRVPRTPQPQSARLPMSRAQRITVRILSFIPFSPYRDPSFKTVREALRFFRLPAACIVASFVRRFKRVKKT